LFRGRETCQRLEIVSKRERSSDSCPKHPAGKAGGLAGPAEAGTPSNYVANLTFQWDMKANKFIEKK
jgi:hypothetical protein